MDESSLGKEETLNEFLENIAKTYNLPYGFNRLETFSERYSGVYQEELSKIMDHIYSANNGGSSRIFGLNLSDLEGILNPKPLPHPKSLRILSTTSSASER